MPLRYEAWITRDMLRAEPYTYWVFGDNLARSGLGGQAKEMRGEPNAIGIPTKRCPSMQPGSFLSDNDYGEWLMATSADIQRLKEHIEVGGTIAWPKDGIGTGLAQLPQRAPKIFEFIQKIEAYFRTL